VQVSTQQFGITVLECWKVRVRIFRSYWLQDWC